MERLAEGPLSFYQRFLRITFHTFRCSCARARAHQYHISHVRPNTHTHKHIPAFSFLSVLPPRLRRPLVLSSFTLHAVLLLPLLIVPRCLRPLRRYCTYVYTRMCVRAPCLNRRARGFHVARLYAPAARGRLYTWVNGKMSFETFLGRSRSPYCQSYTREIPLSRKRSPPRVVRSTTSVARRCWWLHAQFSVGNAKRSVSHLR